MVPDLANGSPFELTPTSFWRVPFFFSYKDDHHMTVCNNNNFEAT